MTIKEKDVIIEAAAWDYINSLDEEKHLGKIAEKYKISRPALSRKVKALGGNVVHPKNKLLFNENIFDSIDTEEKAYWLGFIYADGSISSTPLRTDVKTEYTFELSLKADDTYHLDKFNTFMNHNKNNVKVYSTSCNGKTFKRCRWYVKNKHLWNTLNNYGCIPNKSLTLEFPNKNIFKSEDLIRHFIRGYFDGDGCISITKTNSVEEYTAVNLLGTESFLTNVRDSVISKKVPPIHKYKDSESTKVMFYWGTNALSLLNYLYDNSSIYLQRKFDKYLEICRLYE